MRKNAAKEKSLKKRLIALKKMNWQTNLNMENVESAWLECLETLTTSPDNWTTTDLIPFLGVSRTTINFMCRSHGIKPPYVPFKSQTTEVYTVNNITDTLKGHFTRNNIRYRTGMARIEAIKVKGMTMEEKIAHALKPRVCKPWSKLTRGQRKNVLLKKAVQKDLLKRVPEFIYEEKRSVEMMLLK